MGRRYYIIAGEASGDLHAANLMKGLYALEKSAVIRFRGGEKMLGIFEDNRENGATDIARKGGGMAFDYRSGAVMGFAELFGKLGSIIRNMGDCKRDILRFGADVLILVDYPGFNLPIARWAHRQGIKVFWYIAPKVWASREWRIRSIKKYVDRLFIVFPFEKAYFDSKGVDYVYCGNPLVDEVDGSEAGRMTREEAAVRLGLDPGRKIVALLAGSRMQEVSSMMPLFREVSGIMERDKRFTECQWVVAGAPGRLREDYGELEGSDFKLVFGETQMLLRAADAAVINSGTASLEAVLLGTPQVVAYKINSKFTYWLAKHLLFKAKYISLGNLCLGSPAFKELYKAEGGEEDCNERNVASELSRLLTDEDYRAQMLENYDKIRSSLGEGGASERFARKMISLLDEI